MTLAPILKETREWLLRNLPYRRDFFGEWKVLPGSPLSEETGEGLYQLQNIFQLLGLEEKPERPKKVTEVDRGKPGDPFFLPFVPLFAKGELQKTLPREGIKFVDGTYTFKVSLARNLWRRIEVSAKHTLLDLHYAIQDAYSFDDDHLYSFFMDGEPWSHERFTSPYDDEGPHVDEVLIGESGLSVGQSILYLFDYGDEWRFQVELEGIRLEGAKPRKPRIVAEQGKAPEQYPGYEEDVEEDEE